MARVYSDLRDGSGRRYYYSLATAPGGLQSGVGAVTISGLQPTIFQQISVFRNPAPATITLNGLTVPSVTSVSPLTATLAYVGQIPVEQKIRIISPALPLPDYNVPNSLAPTILFVQSVAPGVGSVQLQVLNLNVTQGGNIGFLNPGVGTVSFGALTPTLIFLEAGVSSLAITGQAPTLSLERRIGDVSPDPDAPIAFITYLTITGLAPSLNAPFQWIDADPPPSTTWTTSTDVAA